MSSNSHEGIKSYPNQRAFQLTGFEKHSIFAICFLLYMINYADRQILSVVMEPLKEDLGLTDTQAGMLHSVFLSAWLFLVFPWPIW